MSKRSSRRIAVSPGYAEALNGTDQALGSIGHGLSLMTDMLSGPLAALPIAEQNKLGFLIDSMERHVDEAEQRLRDLAAAVGPVAEARS